ncbi:hypothetical protein GCM10017653_26540 [Ancylobacter defluvii]|uniref:Uncharacterized protein n=1 Tax=Ancylobacter defluvii TaxID=1282440 RepID=A0A9W6JYD0_9HYPH|nr:hypothetical protein GCM10017653_26540 [Ancylobacter defluvii]
MDFDDPGPFGICLSGMLAAIEFDSQFCVRAKKIDDIATHRNLAAEFPSAELAVAQICPKSLFRVGLIPSQPARSPYPAIHPPHPPLRGDLSPSGRG